MNTVLRVLAILAFLSLSAWGQTPPAPAAAVGYNFPTILSSFTTANVDVGLTYRRGFQWYTQNIPAIGGSNPSGAITINGDGSVTINGFDGNASWSMSTGSFDAKTNSWVGTAYGGGFYIEAVISFDPSLVDPNQGSSVTTAFFGWPIEATPARGNFFLPGSQTGYYGTSQWNGQALGYTNFTELDFFEYSNVAPYGCCSVSTTVHNWYGVYGVTCPTPFQLCNSQANQVAGNFNFNLPTKVGFLWVPATVSAPGSLTWYMNDQIQFGPILYDQYVAASHSPPIPTSPPQSWTFGVTDQLHYMINFGNGVLSPMTVHSVNMWQASTANNIIAPSACCSEP